MEFKDNILSNADFATNPLVSIITPVHNAEKFLRACLESVLAQTYKHWEHIIVDDCSSDNSMAIIREFAQKDSRIKFIQLSKNSGAGVARNKAIEKAAGNYIAFLDSDDLWFDKKLMIQIAFMQDNGYSFTFTSYDKINEAGNKISEVHAKERITYNTALYKNPIGCLTVMYDVSFFGKEFMPVIRKRQDYALWLRLLKKTDAHWLNSVLASYRVGNNSISSNKASLLRYEWKIYREVEGLSFGKSLFYLLSAILLKLKSYF